jgi:carbonic anhydrase
MAVDITPEEALERLMEGNRRWVEERQAHPNRSADRRQELTAGQEPFATVFSCIDSRVPPEIVFDCGTGDLAVVRTGAHVLDAELVLGSLQFCADRLRTPVILVMGHENCGAVAAAIQGIESPAEALPAGLQAIVDALRPAYRVATKDQASAGKDLAERMIQAQTFLTVETIAGADSIAPLVRSGELRVLGAHYRLQTGEVSLLD